MKKSVMNIVLVFSPAIYTLCTMVSKLFSRYEVQISKCLNSLSIRFASASSSGGAFSFFETFPIKKKKEVSNSYYA